MDFSRELIGPDSKPDLPNVTIITTGGTIASRTQSSTTLTGYQPSMGARGLAESVPEMFEVANLWGIELCNILSKDMTTATALQVAQAVREELTRPDVAGVVVTHGTDTLEETAFLLDITVTSDKPVVVVGAMRPASALSADGPMNILQAVSVAASKKAMGRGVMIVMNDRIGSAWYTDKSHANTIDSFHAAEQGYLGTFLEQRPIFFYSSAIPTGKIVFDISTCTALPQVDILYGHQNWNSTLIEAAVTSGAKGIIYCNVGNGSWSEQSKTVARKVSETTGIPMVFSRRPASGFAVQLKEDDWAIASGCLSPQKARILLQLCLNDKKTFLEIKDAFFGTMA